MYRNLKAEIARTGMTSEDCATAIGKSVPTYYRLINGAQDWTLKEMLDISAEIAKRHGHSNLDYLFNNGAAEAIA